MAIYFLDLETKPQADLVELFNKGIKAPSTYKKQEVIDAYIENKKLESKKEMSIDTDYADIICIGLKELGKEPKLYEGSELPVVMDLIKGSQIVTYNGKGFDLPLMIKYGIKNGMDIDYERLKGAMRKYGNWGGHTDLMEEICSYGKFKSMDDILQIYLGIAKKPIDFATATEDEIREHCLEDICNTEKLYNKFKPLFN